MVLAVVLDVAGPWELKTKEPAHAELFLLPSAIRKPSTGIVSPKILGTGPVPALEVKGCGAPGLPGSRGGPQVVEFRDFLRANAGPTQSQHLSFSGSPGTASSFATWPLDLKSRIPCREASFGGG